MSNPEGDRDLIPACRLDPRGLDSQRERYRLLGAAAEAIERGRESLTVRFGSGLDRSLLRETIAIEQRCCPFFSFDHSPDERVLLIGVDRADQQAALDALAFALGADGPPSQPAPGSPPGAARRTSA